MRVWIKRTGIILLIPVVCSLLIFILLYIPSIQNTVAKRAMTYVTESTGMEIGFERIQLSFPFHLSVRNAIVKSADNDTLAYLGRLTVSVRLRPLLKGHISVKKFNLTSVELNTGNLIDGVVFRGKVGKINLSADSIDWSSERIELNTIVLSNADVELLLADTIASDTIMHTIDGNEATIQPEPEPTDSTFNLLISVKKVELKNSSFALRMPYDSVFVNTKIAKAVLANGFVDLSTEAYGASELRAKINELYYATDTEEASAGLDVSHIQLTDLIIAADTLYYNDEGTIYASLKECSAKERSGFVVKSMTGHFRMDSTQIEIPSFRLATAASTLQLQAQVPWLSFQHVDQTGQTAVAQTNIPSAQLKAKASIHKQDVLLALGGQSSAAFARYPETTLTVEVDAFGNTKAMTLKKLEAELPDAISFDLAGSFESLDNERLRSGRVDYNIHTKAIDFIVDLFAEMLPSGFQLPDSMQLTGHLAVDKGVYATETIARESDASITLSGNYDIFTESYEVSLSIDSLEPVHFMPNDSLLWLSAVVYAKGQGTDPYHISTQASLAGAINKLQYGSSVFTDFSFSGNLKDNQLQAELESDYPFVKGRISVDGAITKEAMKGFLIIDVDSLDLYALQMTPSPLSTSFQVFSEFDTDLAQTHSLDITLGNWNLMIDTQLIQPKMLTLAFRSDVDTTHATFFAGDLRVMCSGAMDIETFLDKTSLFAKEAQVQLARDSTIDIQALRPFFPDMSVEIQADRDNTVSFLLQRFNVFFEHFEVKASLSPEDGLKVNSSLVALVKDTLMIDTVRLKVWQDTLGLLYEAGVMKNRFRNQEAFNVNMNGYVQKNEADLFVSYRNNKGEKGLHLGINAKKADDSYDFHFYPEQPIIAFMPFTVNENNYFRFKSMSEMYANLQLRGDTGSTIWIHSDQQDDIQELLIEILQLDLEEISRRFSSIPSLKGLLSVALRYMPMENSFMVIADGNVDNFHFERSPVGDMLINASYLPLTKGTHQIDLHLFHNFNEISSFSVTYQEGRNENKIDGFFSINQLPLQLINPMIPDQMVRLTGALNGKFDINGTDSKPALSGSMQLDNTSAFVSSLSTTFHFEDKPILLTNNKLKFDKYKINTLKDNPFVIDGTIDATNTSRPVADLTMSVSNMQLVDSKRTAESLVYGKLFVNFNSTLNGPLQAMRMRGNMRILGSSNFTYVMADSPLDAADNFGDLVTFTYFADTLPRRTDRPLNLMRRSRGSTATAGTDVLLTINIDPVVRFRIDLDKDQSNYVEMRGGGNLSLQYTTQNDLQLSGRYTLSDGTIRYSIPVIPLTEFFVKNGSYVDWRGNPMNPYLNMSAYTRIRTSVNQDGQTQMVDFNTGIELKDNLEDVSVQFMLEAPTNAVIQNQLTTMGVEERSKQAISLLVAGVYLASGGTGTDNVDLGAALNSLIQRVGSNIVGNLLGNDVPVSFDVNMYDGTKGMGRRTDYLVRFYKDFFNERLNTTIGTRFSTNDPVMGNKFFFDDLSLGYRLDMDGSRQIRLFQSKEYVNLFEGEINRIGAGFTLQRKVKRFNDLFVFRQREVVVNKREEEEDE